MERQFVSFDVADNKYCIDIMDVKEVVRETNITAMPDAPFFVEGIMNLRGIVIPVISVKKKLGLATDDIKAIDMAKEKALKMIIVSLDNILIALIVDNLDRVFSVDISQIQTPEKVTDANIDKNMIDGMVKIEQTIYLLLDIKRILDLQEKAFIESEIAE